MIQWTSFDGISSYDNHYLFGRYIFRINQKTFLRSFLGLNTNNLTITKNFFDENNKITYWQFEVIYTFEFGISKDRLEIEMNKGPENGTCTINPSIGIFDTLFTINCSNWMDTDEIRDYSFYGSIKRKFFFYFFFFYLFTGWTKDPSKQLMLGFTTKSIYQLRLPASITETSFDVIVHIRDTLDSVTEFNLSSVIVFTNISTFLAFINNLPDQALNDENQMIAEQMISSISNVLNELHDQHLTTLVDSK